MLEAAVSARIQSIRSEVRSEYERQFLEHIALAKGYILQKQFEKSMKELDASSVLSREAYSTYGIALDTNAIGATKAQAEKEEAIYRTHQFESYFSKARSRFIAGDYTNAYVELERAKKWATADQMASITELAGRYNAQPAIEIVVEKDVVDWETPVRFKYRASDPEGDPITVSGWDFGDGTGSKENAPVHAYTEWKGPEKQRAYTVRLIVTDGRSTSTTERRVTVKKLEGHYIGYPNGVVLDTKTGLEWVAGPDRDTNWNEAKRWVESLTVAGGGWRMPTMNELEELYLKGKGPSNMTPLLKTTGKIVWSGMTKGFSSAWRLDFSYADRYWSDRDRSFKFRAFAVRSRR